MASARHETERMVTKPARSDNYRAGIDYGYENGGGVNHGQESP